MIRILFLCMGNICRSPAAHCVFQQMVDTAGLSDQFEIESAGTIGFHIGEPPDRRMQAALRSRGVPIIGKARALRAEDLDYYDHILAMDSENFRHVRQLDPEGRYTNKLELFCKYCTEHTETEVPDPYYGGDRGFDHVIDLIQDGCAGLLKRLRQDTMSG